jgi:hypothetical protein
MFPGFVLPRTFGQYSNAHIRADPRVSEERMSSSDRPPRSKYRFGFRGKRVGRGPRLATTDEILDSLTRQAKSMEEDGEERTMGLETILEAGPSDESSQSSNLDPTQPFQTLKTRTFGKSVFALMLLGGVVFLWFYSKLLQNLDLHSLTIVQQRVIDAGFTNIQKVALVAICGFIFALLARRSRNRVRSIPLSAP